MSGPPGVPACLGEDPALFESTLAADHEEARQFCDKCPVKVKLWCLDERADQAIRAVAGCRPTGTWGGMLWTKEGRAVVIEHGTDRGYNQHRHRNEQACKPCVDAHREKNRAKDAARRRSLKAAS